MAAVVVRKSTIHGKGVFAARDFKKGDVVIDWSTCSRLLSKEEVARLPKKQQAYVSYAGYGVYALFSTPGKYVNHSCRSNTKAKRRCDVAIRNIRAGEEITADYLYEDVPTVDFVCRCGSTNCKGELSKASRK